MARKVIDSLWNLWPFLLVLVVSIFMRFWDISIFPKLEVDEDIYRYLADGFWSGQHEMFCIPYTYLPHPPLFFAIGNFFTMLFGNYIVSLRLLSALSGVLVCILIYAVISRYVDRKTGCIAGLAQAVMPTAIVFERLAVGYTLQVFYIFVSLYCFSRFVRIKYADEHQTDVVSSERIWVVFAGVAAGLGFITEVGGVILVVLLVFYFFKQHYDFFWYIMPGAVLLPGMVYFLLFVRHPSWFIADLTINSGRNNMTLFLAAVMYGILIFLIPVARKAMSRMYDFSMKGIIVLWPLYAVIIAAVPMSYPLVRGGYGFYWIGILGLFLLPRNYTRQPAQDHAFICSR